MLWEPSVLFIWEYLHVRIWRKTYLSTNQKQIFNIAKHQSMKFDFKFSKESLEFLDTLVYMDSKNRLQTTLYKKPIDYQNYLHAKSGHLPSLKKSIPYSQALRITRICSTLEEYRRATMNRPLENKLRELTFWIDLYFQNTVNPNVKTQYHFW